MLKIDTHAHYLPRDWPDLAAKYGDTRFPVIHHGDDGRHRIYKDGKFFREIWPKTWDPDVRVADYARFGVQVQVISTVPVMFSYTSKPQHALELHRSLNEHMADTVRSHRRHYAGIERIMLGTDYPFPLGEQEPGSGIAALGLDEASQARLYHGTALDWLGLNRTRFE